MDKIDKDKFISELSKMSKEQITDFLLKKGLKKPVVPFTFGYPEVNKK